MISAKEIVAIIAVGLLLAGITKACGDGLSVRVNDQTYTIKIGDLE